jgi:hypothetical protein
MRAKRLNSQKLYSKKFFRAAELSSQAARIFVKRRIEK